ncbi:hypothetical protein ACFXDJ_31205 [Streptomyces sp. NPDC059443]|uniref:hypothetical protein n=1 Tax=unclassified Streptomyces TaxID=2593676 RepID=UPI0036C69BB4
MSAAGHTGRSAADRPWRERHVVDGLADVLRGAAAERFLGSGLTVTKPPLPGRGPSAGADPPGRPSAVAEPGRASRAGK